MSKTGTRKKHSFIMWTLLSVFVCYCIISFAGNCVDIKEGRDNLKEIEAQVEIKEAENKKLDDMLKNEDLDSYVVKIAHDELGYVFPEERVYYDQQLADN